MVHGLMRGQDLGLLRVVVRGFDARAGPGLLRGMVHRLMRGQDPVCCASWCTVCDEQTLLRGMVHGLMRQDLMRVMLVHGLMRGRTSACCVAWCTV
jgi:hypothetical protein